MKCPKCGYHSFDYLDSCKKCSNDLADHKSKFNLRSLIFPNVEAGPTPESPVPEMAATEEEAQAQVQESALESGSDFGYDFMEDDAPQSPEEQAPPVAAAAFEAEEEAEDDAFSWDDNEEVDLSDSAPESAEPAASAAETASEVVPEPEDFMAEDSSPLDDSFDWDDEEESEEVAALEPQVEEEEAGADLGLDLSWDNDLPTLEEQDVDSGFEAEDELPDWDFDEEPLPDEKKAKKPTGEESPQDPFELRGSGFDQAPSTTEQVAPEKTAAPLAEAIPTLPAPGPAETATAIPETPKVAAEPESTPFFEPEFLAELEDSEEPEVEFLTEPAVPEEPEPELLAEIEIPGF